MKLFRIRDLIESYTGCIDEVVVYNYGDNEEIFNGSYDDFWDEENTPNEIVSEWKLSIEERFPREFMVLTVWT